MKNRFLLFLVLLGFSAGVRADNLSAVQRREMNEMLTRIVQREVAGATVRVERSKIAKGRIWLETTVGLSYYPFREQNVQAIYDSVRGIFPASYRKARVEIYTDRQEIRDLIPHAFRSAASMKKQVRFTNASASERPLVTPLSAPETPSQGLADRHIALWQSHGRYFDQARNCWRWQRSCLWQTCEDLYTQSYVLPYLVPMLENAGANVLLPRERDVQKTELLLDRDPGIDGGGHYAETEGRERWYDGGVGFAHTREVYLTGENPFAVGRTRAVRSIADGAESRAEWRADIPATDEYAVYVSYRSTPESADDAEYTVHHAGGGSRFAVNQTMGGSTWIYLGTFRLEAGRGVPVVSLSNRSQKAGRVVSADAVKIGGGYGNIARTVCDSLRKRGVEYPTEISGYPRFCEGARYWLQWAGFGEEVYAPKNHGDDYKEDYMSRALWVNALAGGSERLPGERGLGIPVDLALAFHSDAGVRDGDEVIGTLGIFCTRDNDGRFEGGASRYRSRDLTDLVMTQIVSDIRRTYEPQWMRRGLWNRSYFEARVPVVPTMLLELLSHQNFADMRYGSDPRFKFTVARSVYKGILRYLASQYDVPYVVQPLPVEGLATRFAGDGETVLTWAPVVDSLEASASPTGYVVYTRVGDRGFDNGRVVKSPEFRIVQEPGVIYSYKVTAINAGGVSFPSEIVAACRVADARGAVLVINGFDRISAPPSEHCDTTAGFCTALDSGVPYLRDISFIGAQRVFDRAFARLENDSLALGACERDYEMEVIAGNTFDYAYLHGRAIVPAGYSFCSASVLAVERGEVALDQYDAVDLILGKQRTSTLGRGVLGPEFRCFPPELQQALRGYLQDGGGLFVSGSYVASDVWEEPSTTDDDRAFTRDVLHYTSGGGRAAERGRVRVVRSNARFASREYDFNQQLSREYYAVESPDALQPAGKGAFTVMEYAENRRPAGVAYAGEYRTVTMGFPFETITSASRRERLMSNILDFLNTEK